MVNLFNDALHMIYCVYFGIIKQLKKGKRSIKNGYVMSKNEAPHLKNDHVRSKKWGVKHEK